MAMSTETINTQSEQESMISRINSYPDMNVILQAVKALDSTSLGNFKAQVDTLWKEKSSMPKPALTEVFPDEVVAAANGFDKGKALTYKDLELLSSNFSQDNYMGWTQNGMLYKGFVHEGLKGIRSGEVTIKVWKNKKFISDHDSQPEFPGRVGCRMKNELEFLQQPDIAMHPCTANVLGYCLEDDKLGVVYDLKPLQTLKKYINNDDFGWRKRVNVAVKLAYLLKFFHENEPQYIVQNLSPAHVMLDQDVNPVLIDYGTIHGGPFVGRYGNEIVMPPGSCGYIYWEELLLGRNSERGDVHGYGVMLLEMLMRCRYDSKEVKKRGSEWISDLAWKKYRRHKKLVEVKPGTGEFNYTFAVGCLRNDPDYDALDGNKVSLLALKCVGKLEPVIPSIGAVIKELEELKLVQSHPELLLGCGVEPKIVKPL